MALEGLKHIPLNIEANQLTGCAYLTRGFYRVVTYAGADFENAFSGLELERGQNSCGAGAPGAGR